MLQRIRRADLLDVVKWYKSSAGPRLSYSPPAQKVGRIECVNVDGTAILPGLRVAPKSFFPASISFENAVNALYNNALKIAVGITSTDDPNWGTALQPSRVLNGIFPATFEGLFTSIVTGSGSYLLSSGALTTEEKDAIGSVLATSAPSSDGRKLALIKPISKGGGGLTEDDVRAMFNETSATVVSDLIVKNNAVEIIYKTVKYSALKDA